MKTKIFILTAMLLCSISISAKELSSVTFKVEKMVCEKCEAKVVENIRFEKGVKGIVTDLKSKQVTISYDGSKTDVPTLIKGFAKFNYIAVEVAARPTKSK